MLRTGAPWRGLPSEYDDGKKAHRRICRWCDKKIWEKILEALLDEPDFEWRMMDASHIKVHSPKKNRKQQRDYDTYLYKLGHLVENAFLHYAAASVGKNQERGKTKGGLPPRYIWLWLRKKSEGFDADVLLADHSCIVDAKGIPE